MAEIYISFFFQLADFKFFNKFDMNVGIFQVVYQSLHMIGKTNLDNALYSILAHEFQDIGAGRENHLLSTS